MNKYEDKEILDLELGGVRMRDMSAISFLHWLAKKIDGVPSYSAANQELVAAVAAPPLSNNMPDDEKVRLCRKLQAIGIELV